MLLKIKTAFKAVNYKLFITLILTGFIPGIYMTLRTFWLGGMPGENVFHIAGQLGWMALIYEVINEAVILPLLFLIGNDFQNKKESANKIRTGLIICLMVSIFLMLSIFGLARPLLIALKANQNYLNEACTFLKYESIASVFTILAQFLIVILTNMGKQKEVYILSFAKLMLIIIFDILLISNLNISAHLGVNGIPLSNSIVNFILLISLFILFHKFGYPIFSKEIPDFTWTNNLIKVSKFSAIEALIRNTLYIILISRTVNILNEQGVYWVAHNFIYGWLLVPIISLCQIIRLEVINDKNHIQTSFIAYMIIGLVIMLGWAIFIPAFKPFFEHAYRFADVHKLHHLVLLLLAFYTLHALTEIGDAFFHGLGKTEHMLLESTITNGIYYGIAIILVFTNTIDIKVLSQVDIIYGIGIAFDAVISLITFIYWCKKDHIKLIK